MIETRNSGGLLLTIWLFNIAMGQSTIYSMVYLLKMPGSIMAMWPFDPRYRCRDHAGGLAEYHQARQQVGGEARGQGDRPECSLAANPDG